MKICMLVRTFLPDIGGGERDAALLVSGLVGRGHDVDVIVQRRPTVSGNSVWPTHYCENVSLWPYFPELLFPSVLRSLRRVGCEVVIAFDSYPLGYVATLVRPFLQFKLVVSPRGGDLHEQALKLRQPGRKWRTCFGYRHADHLVVMSRFQEARLRSVVGARLPPVTIVPNGVDASANAGIVVPTGFSEPFSRLEPFFLHLARVVPIKGHKLVLHAIARIQNDLRDRHMRYVVAGDGLESDSLRSLASELRINDIVVFAGWCRGHTKAWLLANARFLIAASYAEGFGNVQLEALVAELPILFSDIPAHQEVAGELGLGLAYRPDDVDHLCEKLLEMCDSDPSYWKDNARLNRDNFSLDAMIDGYEAACRHALTRS